MDLLRPWPACRPSSSASVSVGPLSRLNCLVGRPNTIRSRTHDPSEKHPETPSSSSNEKLREVRYEHSAHFPNILEQLQLSLLITTYQAGKLLVIGSHSGKLTFAFHDFEQVMGLAVSHDQIAVGTRRQVYFLNAAHECASHVQSEVPHDSAGYRGRQSLPAVSTAMIWLGAKRACGASIHCSLRFVRSVANTILFLAGDRLHLHSRRSRSMPLKRHGNGRRCARYVTVLGETDEPAGWRENKASGGAIIDVPSGETLTRKLCMPHSPRVHNHRLWFCNSGHGNLSHVDRQSESRSGCSDARLHPWPSVAWKLCLCRIIKNSRDQHFWRTADL